jgi:hypothetical protein
MCNILIINYDRWNCSYLCIFPFNNLQEELYIKYNHNLLIQRAAIMRMHRERDRKRADVTNTADAVTVMFFDVKNRDCTNEVHNINTVFCNGFEALKTPRDTTDSASELEVI